MSTNYELHLETGHVIHKPLVVDSVDFRYIFLIFSNAFSLKCQLITSYVPKQPLSFQTTVSGGSDLG